MAPRRPWGYPGSRGRAGGKAGRPAEKKGDFPMKKFVVILLGLVAAVAAGAVFVPP